LSTGISLEQATIYLHITSAQSLSVGLSSYVTPLQLFLYPHISLFIFIFIHHIIW